MPRPHLLAGNSLTPEDVATLCLDTGTCAPSTQPRNRELSPVPCSGDADIRILELSYTSDASVDSALDEEPRQYTQLCSALADAGWTPPQNPFSPACHCRVVLLSNTGQIIAPALATHAALGVSVPESSALLRCFHALAVLLAHYISPCTAD